MYCVSLADLADLNLPKTCQIEFPDPDDLLNFRLIITPDEVHVYTLIIYSTLQKKVYIY